MSYFSQMGSVWVDINNSKLLLNDITAFAAITPTWMEDARVQIPYKVRDGELPHMIAYRLYGSVDPWWTILRVNNIWNFDEQWPRSYKQLNAYIDRKYPGKARTDVHHYLNPQGLVADILSLKLELGLTADQEVIDAAGLEPVSIEEYEMAVNEVKRDIKLVDPDYIEAVQREYDRVMQPEA